MVGEDTRCSLDSFDSGNVNLIVEGQRYTVHRLFLCRDSPVLREMFSGPTEVDACTLSDVTKEEFEHLLWLYYNPRVEYHHAHITVWRNILKLAIVWKMTEIQRIAESHLLRGKIDAIEKIKLCEGSRYHARDAYIQVCTREESLNATEFQALGMDLGLLIMQIRERIIANRRGPESVSEKEIVDDMIGMMGPEVHYVPDPDYC